MRTCRVGESRPGRVLSRSFAAWLVCLAATIGVAQAPQTVPEGEIIADISTTFITAYKPGAWVPIDVMIHNNKVDISGHLDVTVLSASGPVSPTYRVAVDSPKGSRKRFRVYGRLQGASSIRVMVFNKGRRALDLPLSVRLIPLDERDRIGLILDDEPADYGFIYTAIQRGTSGVGLHRHEIRTPDLPQLPDRPQCYEAYNLVVLGQIDPAQIGLRQRGLLDRYVRQGGVLIICAGENAGRFRGTWVEDLAGVAFGAQLTVDEAILAAEVFDRDDAYGGRAGRDVLLTEITRGPADTECLGRERAIAARRPLGKGYVVTVGVDAHGKALQACAGYLRLWNELTEHHDGGATLNFSSAVNTATQNLPTATGVTVYPWTSVLAYLLAYFFVGIIANWLFWSWLKRREMAWVCLVFFSIGFTAYALIYGTAGRAKSTEVAQLEVLQVPTGGTGERHSVIGLLSARTSDYKLSLTHEYSLVSDSWSQFNQPFMQRRRGLFSQSDAFTFVYDSPPRIEDFQVGASVMRVFEVESDYESEGAVEGELVWDEEGLHGTLTNRSGFVLQNPFLLIEGRRISVQVGEETIEVDIDPQRLEQQDYMFDRARSGYYPYGYRAADVNTVKQQFLDNLISRPEFDEVIDPQLGPYLCGWITGLTPDAVRADEPMKRQISHALLVADIDVNRLRATQPAQIALETRVNETTVMMRNDWGLGLRHRMMDFRQFNAPTIEAVVPQNWESIQGAELVLELWHYTDNNATVVFAPHDASGNEVPPGEPGFRRMEAGETGSEDRGLFGPISEWRVVSTSDGAVNVATFRFPDWKDYVDRENGWIKGSVRFVNPGGESRQVSGSFLPRAYLMVPRQAATNGDWHEWR